MKTPQADCRDVYFASYLLIRVPWSAVCSNEVQALENASNNDGGFGNVTEFSGMTRTPPFPPKKRTPIDDCPVSKRMRGQ